jgi:hypothetical protein
MAYQAIDRQKRLDYLSSLFISFKPRSGSQTHVIQVSAEGPIAGRSEGITINLRENSIE